MYILEWKFFRKKFKFIIDKHFIDSILGYEKLKNSNFSTEQLVIMDVGTGAGFPGLVLAIYNPNINFHVKLYEKSRVKCIFLKDIAKKFKINCYINLHKSILITTKKIPRNNRLQ